MHQAITARAKQLGRDPGEGRTLEQREFDACYELLLSGAAGAGPRVEVQVLVPFSTATGGDRELADLPGYGPLLPSTARELLGAADTLRRVCVDATSGQVLAVDDAVRGPARVAPAGREQHLQQTLGQMATDPVVLADLTSPSYRVPSRITRQVRLRDRTCVFPGCTTPARWTDLDHREPWPFGPTSEANLHCLCRHHHRAKQSRFTVTRDPDGTTVWTSTTGRTYRRPPTGF